MFPALSIIWCLSATLAHPGKFHTKQKGVGVGGCAYLEQSSQAMFPEVSLMVRSETNAGYSVSQGSRVCFNFWAVGIRKKKKKKIKNTRHGFCCDWQSTVTQNAVLLPLLRDFSRHSIMHYFLISQVISSAKQLYKL